MRYSAATNGFYPETIDYPNLPEDVVTITDELYNEMFIGQQNGKTITPGVDGRPFLSDYPILTKEQNVFAAEQKKLTLISEATKDISVWQTKLLIGRKLTSKELLSLNTYIDYIDALNAIDTSIASNDVRVDFPGLPTP